MPANDSDGQKRYERFIELVIDLVKAAYVGSLKTENIYKNGQDLWRKVRHVPDEYQQVVNDLKSRSAKQKQHHYFLGQGSIETLIHIRCSKLSSW